MNDRRPEGPRVVTGGAGAIGSVLVARLLSEGHAVEVLDDFSSGLQERLPTGPSAAALHVTKCRLGTEEPPEAAFRGARELWHLAANADVRRGVTDPRIDLTNGTVATFAVLECARRCDVPRIVFSSSSVVYGYPTVFPTPESYGPLQPESLYGAAKLAGEGLLSAFAHTYGMSAYIYRFANIIDGRANHGVLYDFFEKLRADPRKLEVLGDGRQAKSYLRTEECVEGMLTGVRRASDRVNLFNLGSLDRISVREIAEKLVAAHGGTAEIVYRGGDRGWVGDVPQQLLSVEKIGRLGWRPKLSSAEAVDRTIQELAEARGLASRDGSRATPPKRPARRPARTGR
jgi:UDP-glucose 4-epimerase